MCVDRDFLILEIKSSCPVVVILYHTAHRNRYFQFFQNLFTNIYLSLTTIHKDDIREQTECVRLIEIFPLSMSKSSRQKFFHRSIIIRSGHTANAEFAVVIFLRTPILKYYHGTDCLKSIDIGNIVRFDAVQSAHTKQFLNLFHRTKCPRTLSL